jgi:gamma-glutamyltranspeptidase/glutathione hydrolase
MAMKGFSAERIVAMLGNRKRRNYTLRYWLLASAVLALAGSVGQVQVGSPARARRGMVVSAHPLASAAGLSILKSGGNAVDAAVATAFALAVVEPYSSGLGGGGFMMVYPGPGTEVQVLDFRETAPRAARRDLYLRNGRLAPGLSTHGPLAVAVPGEVAGLGAALEKFGSMSLGQVMAPAISLAEDGFTVDSAYARITLLALQQLRSDPCAQAGFLCSGLPCRQGQRLRQPELARTMRRIAEKGPREFYEGEVAAAIVSDLQSKGGIITLEDLAGYRVREARPVSGEYRGYRVVSMPPPSSGGAMIIEMLNLLEGYDLKSLGFGSADAVHLEAEAMRLAFADRSFMGDPAFVQVPLATLLSKEYADQLRKKINPAHALRSPAVVPGGGIIPWSAPAASGPPRVVASGEGPETTHLSVVDGQGRAVSLTQTINTTFGSGVVVCGTGIILNNEMDDFSSAPGAPNVFGLIQGEANAIAPGKVPLSSMSPSLVFKDGKLFMVIGSPGGPRIITTVLQVMINVIDFNMDIQSAISAPRIHHQWQPDQLYLERNRLTPDQVLALARRGHRMKNYFLAGNAQGIIVRPDGSMEGASDPRGVGAPAGYE